MKDSYKEININPKKESIKFLINKNIGLEILRMILCFWIVTCHTCIFKNKQLVRIINSRFHVPSFMIISYYFFYKNLYNRNISKIKARFERLLLPYIIWPIIFIIINNILILLNRQSFFEKKLSINDLMLSYIFGRHINKIFWFQFDLLFISLIFSIISFSFNKKFLTILNSLLILSYILQYSKINYKYFNKYQDLNHRNIGSIAEMIPFNVTGILLYYSNIIHRIKNNKLYVISICIVIIFCLLKYKIFENILGFRYPGIKFNIAGISLFILFSILHTEQIKNRYIIKFILFFTNYTGGIYYLHGIFFYYLKKQQNIFKKKTFKGTIIIYLLTYTFCLIGYKLFKKTKYKNLFI